MATNNGVNVGLSGSTGTGSFVGSTSATLVTPLLGTPTSGNLVNCIGTRGISGFQIFTSGTAATYTKSANVTAILVECVGGGGGGGGTAGAASSISAAGGGAGGGYCSSFTSSPASTYTYTVGAGGAGGTAGNNAGSSGSATTFNLGSMSAAGGGGGPGCPAILTTSGNVTGAGGNFPGTGGNLLNCSGIPGGNGICIFTTAVSGSGGCSRFGGGGTSFEGVGQNNGSAYGGGGSGASGTTTNQAGGNGAAGVIIVWEFI